MLCILNEMYGMSGYQYISLVMHTVFTTDFAIRTLPHNYVDMTCLCQTLETFVTINRKWQFKRMPGSTGMGTCSKLGYY